MSDGGKGSKQRPTDKKKFDENYDKIFGNKQKEKEMQKVKAPKLNSKQEKEVKELVKQISKGAKNK